jgi:hypothetical protein
MSKRRAARSAGGAVWRPTFVTMKAVPHTAERQRNRAACLYRFTSLGGCLG